MLSNPRFNSLHKMNSIYIWGEPGMGKSFVSDLFYDSIDIPDKRRLHFNEFMLEVHEKEHKLNKKLKGQTTDSVTVVGEEIAREYSYLYIDEFQVLDIADAMILKRLFDVFWDCKLGLVLTSNRPPNDLYLNGLQRYLFEPFIDKLNSLAKVYTLTTHDYRKMHALTQKCFYYPYGPKTDKDLKDAWVALTGSESSES